jgi:hypothetical protein
MKKIQKTIVLWALTLMEEHRLRMYENRVLRGTFGHTRGSNRGMEKSARRGTSFRAIAKY